MDPNLDTTFEVDQANHTVVPVHLSASPPHTIVRSERRQTYRLSLVLQCAVSGWCVPHHDGLSLLFQIIHFVMASGCVLIEPSTAAFRHTTDSSSSSILDNFFYLATLNWTKPFATVSTLVEAGVGTLWTASAHDGNGKINTLLVFPRRLHCGYAFLSAVTMTPRHQRRSQSHPQSGGIGQSTHIAMFRVDGHDDCLIVMPLWL